MSESSSSTHWDLELLKGPSKLSPIFQTLMTRISLAMGIGSLEFASLLNRTILPELPIDFKCFVHPFWSDQQKEYHAKTSPKILLEFASTLKLLRPTANARVLCHVWQFGEVLQRDVTKFYASITPSSQKDLSHFRAAEDILFTKTWKDIPREGKSKGTKRMQNWTWVGPTVEQYFQLIPLPKVTEAFAILERRMLEGDTEFAGVAIEDMLKLLAARE